MTISILLRLTQIDAQPQHAIRRPSELRAKIEKNALEKASRRLGFP
jgi:hypothetical protein